MMITPIIFTDNQPPTLTSFDLRDTSENSGPNSCSLSLVGSRVEHWHTGQFAEPEVGDYVYAVNDSSNANNRLVGGNVWYLGNDVTGIRVDVNGLVTEVFICDV